MNKEKAIRMVAAEIGDKAEILQVRRLQTVKPDQYGTYIFGDWIREKAYFVETRIVPVLRGNGFEHYYEKIAVDVDRMIEAVSWPSNLENWSGGECADGQNAFDPRMAPIGYERFCARELERAGWSTQLTAATGDQGADIIGRQAGIVLVLQCKLYSAPVGNDAVQQIFAARTFYSADIAAVVSNQSFTAAARQLATANGVRLLHHSQLATLSCH